MAESYALIKANPLLPAEDYEALRKDGFKFIEKLSSDIWTDYNNSDPGITILEAVCYAITDLAYRTGFEIKDLLAPTVLTEDTWKNIFYTARQILHNSPLTINDYRKLIIDVNGVRNAWIEPSKDYEVPLWVDYNFLERKADHDCGCHDQKMKSCFGKLGLQPVTPEQFELSNAIRNTEILEQLPLLVKEIEEIEKKILALNEEIAKLKIDGLPAQSVQKILDKLNRDKRKLNTTKTELEKEISIRNEIVYSPSKIVEIEGLYNVMVEYEEDVLDEERREEVRQQVVERLMSHRNLCEDFLTVNAVEYLDFGIGAKVVLEEYADPDEVLAEMFYVIYKYFTPTVWFYSIPQMQAKGYQVDEIFDGPALQHGFIDSNELEKTDLYRDIRLSDIINEMVGVDGQLGIKGIKAITYLHLPFYAFNGATVDTAYFDQWVKLLEDERKIARIQPSLSSVMFCKEHDFITYNVDKAIDKKPGRMLKMFNDKKKLERSYKLTGHANDFPVPAGENMELQDYFPVTQSLPMCYGVSERAGLPADASQKRIVQSLQLKGYLLFFEQILSDYLVQLDHLRELFGFETIDRTYFTKALVELGSLKELIIDHAPVARTNFEEIVADFSNTLQYITESPALFNKRRNEYLSHMLGRFHEDLEEYEKITQWLSGGNAVARIIKDKERILKNGAYYKISTNRGKAFNYTRQGVWDTPNVSGSEMRIGRLLGFSNVTRRTLAPDYIVVEAVMLTDEKTKVLVRKKTKKGKDLSIIKIYNPNNTEELLLTSVEVVDGCCTEDLISDIIGHADNRICFTFHEELKQRSRKAAGVLGVFWFELWDSTDPDKAVLLASSEIFEKKEDREAAYKSLQHVMVNINENEGLHLVEHVLLRPRIDEIRDEAGIPFPVILPDICLDICDLGKGLLEGYTPLYQKRIHRIPPDKCYDKMPWILEYFGLDKNGKLYDQSILYQETFRDTKEPIPLKFRHYEQLAKRVKALQEFGSERINYKLDSNSEEQPVKIKYSFKIFDSAGNLLAQSPYAFNKKTAIQEKNKDIISEDIEIEIENLMNYFGFLVDLYCEENPCDHNEDPFSFRTTLVLPCWPRRLRDKTFQHLVEKTIEAETPAHIHTNVIWLGIAQMKAFEKDYTPWLRELAQTELPGYEYVNPLIERINTLEPCGSCTDDCNHN